MCTTLTESLVAPWPCASAAFPLWNLNSAFTPSTGTTAFSALTNTPPTPFKNKLFSWIKVGLLALVLNNITKSSKFPLNDSIRKFLYVSLPSITALFLVMTAVISPAFKLASLSAAKSFWFVTSATILSTTCVTDIIADNPDSSSFNAFIPSVIAAVFAFTSLLALVWNSSLAVCNILSCPAMFPTACPASKLLLTITPNSCSVALISSVKASIDFKSNLASPMVFWITAISSLPCLIWFWRLAKKLPPSCTNFW